MEIKYKATYVAPNKQYSLGEIPIMLGYAIEIVDLRPELAEGKLQPGQLLRILFGLTPEEYALKDAKESRELAELAAKLRKVSPADRLIGWRVTDLRGVTVACKIKPKTAPSIDEGVFAQRVRERMNAQQAGPIDEKLLHVRDLQKLATPKDAPQGVKDDLAQARAELGAALTGLGDLFVADDVLLKGRFPAEGFDGRTEIFTTLARAERVRAAVTKMNADTELWQIRQIPGAEIEGFFRSCADRGLFHFRVDNGFASAELQLSDFRTDMPAENALLRGNMIREIEYGVRFEHFKKIQAPEKNIRGAYESVMTMRNFVWRDVGNAVLYALCMTDEGGDEPLCTAAARVKCDPTRRMHIVKAEKSVVLNEKNNDRHYFAAFTSEILAASFAEKLDQSARPVAVTFDDLRARTGQLTGINIDCETLGYRLMKEAYDQVVDLRGKPPMIVRVKDAEKKPEAEPPKPAADEDAGGLPDPDKIELPDPVETAKEAPVVPEKPATEENEAEVKEAGLAPETEKPQKKGFFRRFFGHGGK